MQIFIKTLLGTVHTLGVTAFTTVEEVKESALPRFAQSS